MTTTPDVRRPTAYDRGCAPTLIWAESPLQMLSAVECYHSGVLGDRADLVPRTGLPTVTRTAVELSLLDLPSGLRLAEPSGAPPAPSRDGTWVVGDAFSGQVQRRLLLSPPPERMVVVDDGLATVHLLDLLTRPRPAPIVRARARVGSARTVLGLLAARRLRATARAGRLTVFTSLPVGADLARRASDLGVRLLTHDYPWLRAQPVRSAPGERTVVLGTALVANGLVRPEPYLAWVRELASREPVAYYPHPREDARTLEELQAERDVTVRALDGPVEMRLRGLRPHQRVVSLPSTAVSSLRQLLASSGAAVDGRTVPDEWWTLRVSDALRAHLNLSVEGCRERGEQPTVRAYGPWREPAAPSRGPDRRSLVSVAALRTAEGDW